MTKNGTKLTRDRDVPMAVLERFVRRLLSDSERQYQQWLELERTEAQSGRRALFGATDEQ